PSAEPGTEEPPHLRGRWRFASYRADQGLRNLVNRHIVQTADRLIWVSSDDGLYRFDGDRFTRLGLEAGLPSTQITLLHPGSKGQLWVGTRRGLAVLEDGQVRLLPSPPGQLTALAEVA